MSDDIAIRVRNLSKRFYLAPDRRGSLKERAVRGKSREADEFWALRDVSFDVRAGSFFGIVGHNGSGKSTALKIIAGIYRPTSGVVEVNGQLRALLELGAGFHPELTGRENIMLNASILGMSQRDIRGSMDEIIDFAGIGRFIDSPVKVYSSGMAVRLGFAVAVKMNPEILIVDEVIAVGDEAFQRRCHDYMFDLRKRGTTIVLVTHSMAAIESMCDEAVWLDHGRVRAHGPGPEVVREYVDTVNQAEAQGRPDAGDVTGAVGRPTRIGSGEIECTGFEILGPDGARDQSFLVTGAPGTLRVHYEAHEALPAFHVGLVLNHESGIVVAHPTTVESGSLAAGVGNGYVDFVIPRLLLNPGSYWVSTTLAETGHYFDHIDRGFTLKVRGGGAVMPGLMILPGEWVQGSDQRPPVAER